MDVPHVTEMKGDKRKNEEKRTTTTTTTRRSIYPEGEDTQQLRRHQTNTAQPEATSDKNQHRPKCVQSVHPPDGIERLIYWILFSD